MFTAGANMLIAGVASGSNYTASAGDVVDVVAVTTTQFKLNPKPYTGSWPCQTVLTNSLSGDVALNNTATYFAGPSVAQGTVGTWLFIASVTLIDSAGSCLYSLKITDGTTIASSSAPTGFGVNDQKSASLVGIITNPVGNVSVQVKDNTSTSGKIIFNASGNSKDSTLIAIRIA